LAYIFKRIRLVIAKTIDWKRLKVTLESCFGILTFWQNKGKEFGLKIMGSSKLLPAFLDSIMHVSMDELTSLINILNKCLVFDDEEGGSM